MIMITVVYSWSRGILKIIIIQINYEIFFFNILKGWQMTIVITTIWGRLQTDFFQDCWLCSFCDLYSCFDELFALFLHFCLHFLEFWVLRQCICPHCSFSSWNVLFICLFLFFSFFFAYIICYSFLTTVFFFCCLVLYFGFLNNVISTLIQFFWLLWHFYVTVFSFLLLYCVYICSNYSVYT